MMSADSTLAGIIPAVPTPLTDDDEPHLPNLQTHIRSLEEEGCQGILLAGSAGEGVSLSSLEREAVIAAGAEAAGAMTVIAATGAANLPETLRLTRTTFKLGAHVALIVPPFYYKRVKVRGLTQYFLRILEEAVPEEGRMMLYHFPQLSGVPVSFELMEALLEHDPHRVVGLKDSSGDVSRLQAWRERFPDLRLFVGDDRLLLEGLRLGAAGCISAPANLLAPLSLAVLEGHEAGDPVAENLQDLLTEARMLLEAHQPFPATIKALLAERYGTSGWNVRPPLEPLPEREKAGLLQSLSESGAAAHVDWLHS
jgi:4-hydroxy-tetrahydrodipicolinate synthase